MIDLYNAMRREVERHFARKFIGRLGIVTGWDPNKYAVKVSIQPEGIATGWVRYAASWAGNGWGVFAPPSINNPVSLAFIDGELTASYCSAVFFNDDNIPTPVQSGEYWILHSKGGFAKFTNDGSVTFSDGHGAIVRMDGTGNIVSQASNWTHTGPLNVDGNTSITGNLAISGTFEFDGNGTVDGVNIKFHTHTSESPGSPTSPPL